MVAAVAMPKAANPSSARKERRHNPLEDDLLATGPLRAKQPRRKSKSEQGGEENFVDSRASRRILSIGRELAQENDRPPPRPPADNDAFAPGARFDEVEEGVGVYGDDEAWGDEDEVVEEIEVEPADLDTYNKILPSDEDPLLKHGWGGQAKAEEENPQGTNLADLILAKIAAHEASQARAAGEIEPVDEDYELPPKVVEVYTK